MRRERRHIPPLELFLMFFPASKSGLVLLWSANKVVAFFFKWPFQGDRDTVLFHFFRELYFYHLIKVDLVRFITALSMCLSSESD
jgi:hypothetical protein